MNRKIEFIKKKKSTNYINFLVKKDVVQICLHNKHKCYQWYIDYLTKCIQEELKLDINSITGFTFRYNIEKAISLPPIKNCERIKGIVRWNIINFLENNKIEV